MALLHYNLRNLHEQCTASAYGPAFINFLPPARQLNFYDICCESVRTTPATIQRVAAGQCLQDGPLCRTDP